MKRSGRPITVVLPDDGPFIDLLKAEGIHTRILPLFIFYYCSLVKTRVTLKNLLQVLKTIAGNLIIFPVFLIRLKPTLVVINTATPLLCGLIARLLRYRVIWHVREIIPIGQSKTIEKLLSATLRFSAQTVIAMSDFSKKNLEDLGIPRPKLICDGAVNLDRFQVRARNANECVKLGLSPSDPVVGFVGMLFREKGWPVFVQAAFLILQKLPEAKFLVVGSADMRMRPAAEVVPPTLLHAEDTSFRDMVLEMKMEHAFRFLGQRFDVEELLPLMDCLAFTTVTSEAFGRVMVEAMACGIPVVASDTGASAEIVESEVTGLLVRAGDPRVLAEALIRLLTDKEKAGCMGRLARARAERLFDIEKTLAGLEALYALDSKE